MKYRKKPIAIEATQWLKNGDHPQDNIQILDFGGKGSSEGDPVLSEGKVVRYYRHPSVDGETLCRHCGLRMHVHGWIDTLEGGHIVCPGDWIITGVVGEHYPIKNEIFLKTYEPAPPQREDGFLKALDKIGHEISNHHFDRQFQGTVDLLLEVRDLYLSTLTKK